MSTLFAAAFRGYQKSIILGPFSSQTLSTPANLLKTDKDANVIGRAPNDHCRDPWPVKQWELIRFTWWLCHESEVSNMEKGQFEAK